MTFFARAVFVLLVGATFFAFFAAQRLKSAPPVAKLVGTARYFSPNEDGRRDTQRYGIQVQESDDVTLTVVDRDGNDVRRIATAVPADPDQPLRATWDGTGSDGRRAPDGRYLLRANLRKLGRAVTLHPGVYLDTSAPTPTVFAGGAAGRWITGPVAKPVQYRVRGVSSRRPTQVTVLRTDGGPPREVASYVLPRGVRRGVWDGKANGAAAPPGTYLIAAAVRDTAGNVGRSAPVEPEPGTIGGRPGVSVRRLLARPPSIPCGRVSARASPSTRAGGRTRGTSAASAPTARSAAGGRAPAETCRSSSRPAAPASTCWRCARAATSPACPSRSRTPSRRRSSSSSRASRGSAATSSTTTVTGSRTRSTTAARPTTRACSPRASRRDSRHRSPRCSRSSTGRGSATT